MAKTQIKYITKESNEVIRFLLNHKIESFDVTKHLSDFSNFGLIFYKYSKPAGIIFISNREDKRILETSLAIFENKEDLIEIVEFLINKFQFYSFIIPVKYINTSSLKKFDYKKDNSQVVIKF